MMFVDYTQPQMMRRPAHITMNASLSHYLYIMATTPPRGQASSRLINSLTARPKEKWGARQRCSLLIHRLHLTARPRIACTTLPVTLVCLFTRRTMQLSGTFFRTWTLHSWFLLKYKWGHVLKMRPCCKLSGEEPSLLSCLQDFFHVSFLLQLIYLEKRSNTEYES